MNDVAVSVVTDRLTDTQTDYLYIPPVYAPRLILCTLQVCGDQLQPVFMLINDNLP